jgi:uncharacterized protein with GYD domain
MATFFMFGKYTTEALKKMSAQRTQEAVELVKKCGGTVKGIYALLGQNDLVLILDFPTTEDAMKASVALSRSTGIGFSTSLAFSVEQFDKLIGEL